MVDKIADPLVHMVRNAIDHGIEPREAPDQAGKNPTGRVELRAFHQAGNIVIEMEDDGKGLDKDRILKKAVEQGLVEPGQELSEDDAFKLIFHPGLSTAEKVTSISGRGVGMDVVKKNIEALRGRIEIRSTPGKGTTFTIRLPLTLAVIDGQVVRIGSDRYIMPINSIVRSLRPTRDQISTVQGRGEMILERGELIPLVRLYRLFDVAPSTEDPTAGPGRRRRGRRAQVLSARGRSAGSAASGHQEPGRGPGAGPGRLRRRHHGRRQGDLDSGRSRPGGTGAGAIAFTEVGDMAGLMLQEVVLGEREFRLISDLVYEHCGINLHDGKKELVRARLAKRLREGNFRTFSEYIRHVLDDPTGNEFALLVDSLSTNLTKFFREEQHFEYLRSRWLPRAAGGQAEPPRLSHSRLERRLLLGRGAVLHRHYAARSGAGPGPVGRQAAGDRCLHPHAREGPGGPL